MTKGSIIELTNMIDKYKQEIFWLSQNMKKTYDKFYKKQSEYSIYTLTHYKQLGYFEINTFLYDRKLFFSEYKKYLFLVIDDIYKKHKTLDKNQLKEEIINNIYYSFYRIIKSISTIDALFAKAPKLDTEIVVYRGLKFITPKLEEKMVAKLSKLKKNDIFINENYLSTSMLNTTALDFLESHFSNEAKPKCCLFKIIIPKNTRVLYLDSDLTGFDFLKYGEGENTREHLFSEYEILLPRSTQLKFIKKYTISGKVPTTCKVENIKKGKITDILVYEFKMVGINPKREIFSDAKAKDPEYLKHILKDLNHISFNVQKSDILYFGKNKNISHVLNKFEKNSQERIKKFRKL